MIYDWYKVFNLTEFEATSLVSRTVSLILADIGQKTFLITKGNAVSLTVDGVMLALNLNTKNPFEFDDRAIYIDENDDVFYGVLVP